MALDEVRAAAGPKFPIESRLSGPAAGVMKK